MKSSQGQEHKNKHAQKLSYSFLFVQKLSGGGGGILLHTLYNTLETPIKFVLKIVFWSLYNIKSLLLNIKYYSLLLELIDLSKNFILKAT